MGPRATRTGRSTTPVSSSCVRVALADRRYGDLYASGAHGMNVIFFSRREGRARQFDLAHPVTLGIVAALGLGILGTAFALGLQLGTGHTRALALGESTRWTAVLAEQKSQIADQKRQLQERVDAMAMRLGEINAHVIRLDALGKRLTEMADIDNREFDFGRDPPTGGPEADGEGVSAQVPDLSAMLASLEARV